MSVVCEPHGVGGDCGICALQRALDTLKKADR
jgi:hypothetical protein